MAVFVFVIIYLHRKKQLAYQQKLDELEASYEKNLLKTQLEIQEQTFQHISREIHDNINLSLTLAKVNLFSVNWNDPEKSDKKVNSSIDLLTKSIAELSDISKGLNADLIAQQGLLTAIEEEIQRIRHTDLFKIDLEITGTPVYMDNEKELIIFRIVQEAFNNIIKHAKASYTKLVLHYNDVKLVVTIIDNGKGFSTEQINGHQQAGLKNMQTRVKMLNGDMHINSRPDNGTVLIFNIPFEL